MNFNNTAKRHLAAAVVLTGLGFAGVYQQSLLDQQAINPQLMADIVSKVEVNPLTARNPITSYDAEAIIERLQEDNTELSETRMPRIVGGSVIYPVFG